MNNPIDIDAVDRRLLALLQQNCALTNQELAAKAHLSPATCLRRVRRLRESGQTVVFDLPGAAAEECGRSFDRELVKIGGQWVLRPA